MPQLQTEVENKSRPDNSSHPGSAIADEVFSRYLKRLRELQEFLYQEAVPVSSSQVEVLELGELNVLYFDGAGRKPTAEEWNQVGRRTQAIYFLLTPSLR